MLKADQSDSETVVDLLVIYLGLESMLVSFIFVVIILTIIMQCRDCREY